MSTPKTSNPSAPVEKILSPRPKPVRLTDWASI
jgi:hypothetical protein